MKKAILAAMLLTGTIAAQAQNDAVTSAFFYQKEGKLDKAKAEIDRALENEKTKDKAKTWFFKGSIYQDIFKSPDAAVNKLAPNAGLQAYEAYAKAKALDKKGGEYDQSAERNMEELRQLTFNKGVMAYQAGSKQAQEKASDSGRAQFREALTNFQLASKMQPQDTTAVLYSAYAAESLKDYATVSKMYAQLIALGRKTPDMYRTLSQIARSQGNQDEALKYVQEGRKAFPNDPTLATEELALLSSAGKLGDSMQKMEEAIKLDPQNASLYAALAATQDQASKDQKRPKAERDEMYAKSIQNFQKTLELDPNHAIANFDLGVHYFNQGVVITKKVNNMTLNDYQKTGKKLEADAKALYMKSLPYFEKAYAAQPTEKDYSSTLKKVYLALDRKADAAKIKE